MRRSEKMMTHTALEKHQIFRVNLLLLAAVLAGCQPIMLEDPPAVSVPATGTATMPASLNLSGPVISPLLVGNNAWMYPDARVWNIASQVGLRIIRIGGIAFDKNILPNNMLADYVAQIKAMGAAPMIQVSRFDGPDAAAAVVRYFNIETGDPVQYWNIGNEPFCGHITESSASEVAAYIKPIATAMKAMDPAIKIFAPDECYFYEDFYSALFSGDDSPADISGKVPGQEYYYIDGISWHMYVGYPPENIAVEQLTTAGAATFEDLARRTRLLVDQVNTARERSGADALQWGIGEFNSSDGQRVCTFENGQMFAEVYGELMKYGAAYGATWSMFENGGRCFVSDFSFVDAKMQPRSSYYHMQMVAQNFNGNYLEGSSNLDTIRAYGAVDVNLDRISVMLLNISVENPQTCVLRLDATPIVAAGCQVNLPAGLDVEVVHEIASQTSVVLIFDLRGKLLRTISYSKGTESPTTNNNPQCTPCMLPISMK